MRKFLSHLIGGVLSLWLAVWLVPGVTVAIYPDSGIFGFAITAHWEILLFMGVILGLLTFFAKPIINAISLPLRLITLGLSSILVNGLLVWVLDQAFKELSITLWLPLLYTALIVWGLQIVLSLLHHE